MPELPEVETIARTLRPELVGKTIVEAEVRWRRTIASPSVRKFKEQICGQEILEVGRRAKFLVLRLSSLTLLFHLRMSGDLRIERSGLKPLKHDRLILLLSSLLSAPSSSLLSAPSSGVLSAASSSLLSAPSSSLLSAPSSAHDSS